MNNNEAEHANADNDACDANADANGSVEKNVEMEHTPKHNVFGTHRKAAGNINAGANGQVKNKSKIRTSDSKNDGVLT